MPLKPPNSKARARTDVSKINEDLKRDLATLRNHIAATGNDKVRAALVELETFAAVAIRVMAKTNPSKIHDEARAVEIAHYMKEKKC